MHWEDLSAFIALRHHPMHHVRYQQNIEGQNDARITQEFPAWEGVTLLLKEESLEYVAGTTRSVRNDVCDHSGLAGRKMLRVRKRN